jgi:Domain of unknown function (DUF1707)/Inner membrane component of T3SS, cytoplasmic domain
MRASDRDRERAVALLRARCVEGYISIDTFEHRLGRALRARSANELRVLVADVARVGRPWLRRRAAQVPAAHLDLPAAGTIVVGRSRGCDVVMSEPTVSRRHLELRAVDGAWLAVDLGSCNGTWLLGRRVSRSRVMPGDELMLGDCAVVLEPTPA